MKYCGVLTDASNNIAGIFTANSTHRIALLVLESLRITHSSLDKKVEMTRVDGIRTFSVGEDIFQLSFHFMHEHATHL